MLGKTLAGRYEVVRHLGQGGFGQTFLANDHYLPGQPLCVVKQFLPLSKDPHALKVARRLFDTEAEVLHRLGTHPQIPGLYAHFEEQHEFYLIQEYIEGVVLKDELLPQQRFPEAQVLSLMKDILSTLEFVHQQGVIHRDIKPSNLIRRARDGRIVVIDFGAVKQVSQSSSLSPEVSSLTVAIGSHGYVPNEQLAGQPHFSSDVYAVGVLAIQALTGISPGHLHKDVKTGELIWHQQAQISLPFLRIIDKMVRYDFRQRYACATDALADLQMMENLGSGLHTMVRTVPQRRPPTPAPSTQIQRPTTQVSDPPPPLPPSTQLALELIQTQQRRAEPKFYGGMLMALVLAGVGTVVVLFIAMQTIVALSQKRPSLQGASPENPSALSTNAKPSGTPSTTTPAPPSPPSSPMSGPEPSSSLDPLEPGDGNGAGAGPLPPRLEPPEALVPEALGSEALVPEALVVLQWMTRLQEAFHAERGRFAANSQLLDRGLPTRTDQFDYRIVSSNSRQMVVIATARQPDLKSYASAVFIVDGEPIAGTCETLDASRLAPQSITVDGTAVQCPQGSVAIANPSPNSPSPDSPSPDVPPESPSDASPDPLGQ